MTPAQEFASLYARTDVTPEHLAFAIARVAHPDLDVEELLGRLDALATLVRGEAMGRQGGTDSRLDARRLLDIVCRKLDFRGNQEAYYDPHNSLLPDVLETRMGLPIMLCVVCMALGRRLGLAIDGLAFPSHFLAVCHEAAGAVVLDPFWGVALQPDEVEQHLARLLGRPVQLAGDAWQPATAQAIALRILANLRHAYLAAKDLRSAARVMDFLIAAQPGEAQYWRERGLIHYRERRWEETHYDLRRYLMRSGLLPSLMLPGLLTAPNPAATKTASSSELAANPGDKRVLAIYREAAAMLGRVN